MMAAFSMRRWVLLGVLVHTAVLVVADDSSRGNFSIVNGQVFTPGLAIIDAPQPFTPMGGDTLQVAIDVSADGRLPWPPSTQSPNSPTLFHDMTIFLTSYITSRNFTISNGSTVASDDSSAAFVGPVLNLEPSSTVKHVNWMWPACLVGDDAGSSSASSNVNASANSSANANVRGAYNISIHQSFRWNGTDYYTVFDLPISVTNSIDADSDRVDCGLVENPMMDAGQIANSSSPLPSPGGNTSWPLLNKNGTLVSPASGGVTTTGQGGRLPSNDGGAQMVCPFGAGVVLSVMFLVIGLWSNFDIT